jgi:hypothetical protein
MNRILKVVILVIGITGIGIGCGTSSGSGNKVSSGVNSLPPANLTVQNIGAVATNVFKTVSTRPTDVSAITSSTVANAPDQSMPLLSLMNHMGNAVIKPGSMKEQVLKGLAVFKQAQVNGYCSPTIADNSAPGNINVTITWNNVSCSFSGTTLTIDGSITVKGTYNESLGSLNITESYNNLTFKEQNQDSTLVKITLNGAETISGAGIVAGSTSITYSDKGNGTISGNVTTSQGNVAISGWVSVDDTFTGSLSQLVYAINYGREINIDKTKIADYGVGTITMTVGSSTLTINGGGTFGVTGTTSSANVEGRYSTLLSNVKYDNNICSGWWPADGTLTITANHVFVLDFSGTTCGCANVTVDGTQASGNPICSFYY